MSAVVSALRPDTSVRVVLVGEEELLTVDEVAVALKRSADAVRWLLKPECPVRLRSAKVGGRRMVRFGDLQAYIDAAFAAEPGTAAQ